MIFLLDFLLANDRASELEEPIGSRKRRIYLVPGHNPKGYINLTVPLGNLSCQECRNLQQEFNLSCHSNSKGLRWVPSLALRQLWTQSAKPRVSLMWPVPALSDLWLSWHSLSPDEFVLRAWAGEVLTFTVREETKALEMTQSHLLLYSAQTAEEQGH